MSEKKILGDCKYLINGTVVEIWKADAADDAPPFLHQPFNPDTLKYFSSAEEAEQWAISHINNQ